MEITKKSFSFPKKHDMPLYFVSAADGTNVVRLFRDAIRLANAYRTGDTQDFIDQVLRELEVKNSGFIFYAINYCAFRIDRHMMFYRYTILYYPFPILK
jgi:hypothetical protein